MHKRLLVLVLLAMVVSVIPTYAGGLTIDYTDLNCREGFDGGYSRCELEVSLSAQLNMSISTSVNVSCDVDYTVEAYKDYFPSRKSAWDSDTIYVSYGSGSTTMYIDLPLGFNMEPVIAVRVRGVECRAE